MPTCIVESLLCGPLIRSSRCRLRQPLGDLVRNGRPYSALPARGTLPVKRSIPHVRKVIAVASGKGGVGKSTIAVNLALTLQRALSSRDRPARVGLLDLDIYGPSIPKLMGLEHAPEPRLTQANKLVPLFSQNLQTMSIGFLLPRSANSGSSENDTAVVWRGLMVQKATQQLLFDVDWRMDEEKDLDLLVIDMPPGTGDVQLTLGQSVKVDGAVIVSTPQDVALLDARKGVVMFRKVGIPILGLLLNFAYFTCSNCKTPHRLFGNNESFYRAAKELDVPVLGEVPLVPNVSSSGDRGIGVCGEEWAHTEELGSDSQEIIRVMGDVGGKVWQELVRPPT